MHETKKVGKDTILMVEGVNLDGDLGEVIKQGEIKFAAFICKRDKDCTSIMPINPSNFY